MDLLLYGDDDEDIEFGDYDPGNVASNENLQLEACPICSRTFKPDTLAKHMGICEKMQTKKRKPFDSFRQRREGTELADYLPKNFGLPQQRMSPQSHDQKMISTKVTSTPITQRKSSLPNQPNKNSPSTAVIKMLSPKDHHHNNQWPAMATSTTTTNRPSKRSLAPMPDICPYCERSFCIKAYDRHVEWCREKSRISNHNTTASYAAAKERLEARTKYRVPNIRSKREQNREKYSGMSCGDSINSLSDCGSLFSGAHKSKDNSEERERSLSISMTSSVTSEGDHYKSESARSLPSDSLVEISVPPGAAIDTNNITNIDYYYNSMDDNQIDSYPDRYASDNDVPFISTETKMFVNDRLKKGKQRKRIQENNMKNNNNNITNTIINEISNKSNRNSLSLSLLNNDEDHENSSLSSSKYSTPGSNKNVSFRNSNLDKYKLQKQMDQVIMKKNLKEKIKQQNDKTIFDEISTKNCNNNNNNSGRKINSKQMSPTLNIKYNSNLRDDKINESKINVADQDLAVKKRYVSSKLKLNKLGYNNNSKSNYDESKNEHLTNIKTENKVSEINAKNTSTLQKNENSQNNLKQSISFEILNAKGNETAITTEKLKRIASQTKSKLFQKRLRKSISLSSPLPSPSSSSYKLNTKNITIRSTKKMVQSKQNKIIDSIALSTELSSNLDISINQNTEDEDEEEKDASNRNYENNPLPPPYYYNTGDKSNYNEKLQSRNGNCTVINYQNNEVKYSKLSTTQMDRFDSNIGIINNNNNNDDNRNNKNNILDIDILSISGQSDKYDPFISAKRQLEELFSPTTPYFPSRSPTRTRTSSVNSFTRAPTPTKTTNTTNNKSPTQLLSQSLNLKSPLTSTSRATAFVNHNHISPTTNLNNIKSNFKRTSSLRIPKKTSRPTIFTPNFKPPTIQRGISDEGPISSNFMKPEEYDELPVKSHAIITPDMIPRSPTKDNLLLQQQQQQQQNNVIRRDPNTNLNRRNLRLDLKTKNALRSPSPPSLTQSQFHQEQQQPKSAPPIDFPLSKTDSLAIFLKYENEINSTPTASYNTASIFDVDTSSTELKSKPMNNTIIDDLTMKTAPGLTEKELKDKSNSLNRQSSSSVMMMMNGKNSFADLLDRKIENEHKTITTAAVLASELSPVQSQPQPVIPSNVIHETQQTQSFPKHTPQYTTTPPSSAFIKTQITPNVNDIKKRNSIKLTPIKLKANKLEDVQESSDHLHHHHHYIDPKLINICDNLSVNITKLSSDSDLNNNSSTTSSCSSSRSSIKSTVMNSNNNNINPIKKSSNLILNNNNNNNTNNVVTNGKLNTHNDNNFINSNSNNNNNNHNNQRIISGEKRRQLRLSKDNFLYDLSPTPSTTTVDQFDQLNDGKRNENDDDDINIIKRKNQSSTGVIGSVINKPKTDIESMFNNFDFDEFISSFEDDEQFPIFKDYKDLMERNSISINNDNLNNNNNNNDTNSSSSASSSINGNELNDITQNDGPNDQYNRTESKSQQLPLIEQNHNRIILTQAQNTHTQSITSPKTPNTVTDSEFYTNQLNKNVNRFVNNNGIDMYGGGDEDKDDMFTKSIYNKDDETLHQKSESIKNDELTDVEKELLQSVHELDQMLSNESELIEIHSIQEKSASPPAAVVPNQHNYYQQQKNLSSSSSLPMQIKVENIKSTTTTPSYPIDSDELSSVESYPLRRQQISKLSADSAYGSLSRQSTGEKPIRRSSNQRNNNNNNNINNNSNNRQPNYQIPDIVMNNNPNNNNNNNTNINNNKQRTQIYKSDQKQRRSSITLSSSSSGSSDNALPPISLSSKIIDPIINNRQHNNNNNTINQQSSTSSKENKLSKFCHECGNRFTVSVAKFCMECGVKRIMLE